MKEYEIQYEAFRRDAINRGAEYCWDHGYQIGFYINIYDIISELYDSTEEIRKLVDMIEVKQITLDDIWYDYLDEEHIAYDDWEQFFDFIENEIMYYTKHPKEI